MPSEGLDSSQPVTCASCGASLPPGVRFCPYCGTEVDAGPPPSPFAQTEQLLEELKRERAARRLSESDYLERLARLTVQDDRGTWRLVAGTGEWLWHDGRSWVHRDPHVVQRPAEAVAPAGQTTLAAPDRTAPPSPPAQAPKKGRSRLTCFLIALLSVGLLCICAAVFVWLNASSLFDFTVTTSGLRASSSSGSARAAVSLSSEQEELVKEFGWPQSFTVADLSDDDGNTIRFETWQYLDAGVTYNFSEGQFLNWETAGPLADQLGATPYQPNQFALGQSSDEVHDAIRPDGWEQLDGMEVLFEGVEMYAAKQLLLTFRDDRLIMVDAVAVNGGS